MTPREMSTSFKIHSLCTQRVVCLDIQMIIDNSYRYLYGYAEDLEMIHEVYFPHRINSAIIPDLLTVYDDVDTELEGWVTVPHDICTVYRALDDLHDIYGESGATQSEIDHAREVYTEHTISNMDALHVVDGSDIHRDFIRYKHDDYERWFIEAKIDEICVGGACVIHDSGTSITVRWMTEYTSLTPSDIYTIIQPAIDMIARGIEARYIYIIDEDGEIHSELAGCHSGVSN